VQSNNTILICSCKDIDFMWLSDDMCVYLFFRFDHTQCPHLQGKDKIAFSPFGYGRRRCPGYNFTYVEVGVFLTILLQKFTITPFGEAKDVKRAYGLITIPSEVMKFHIHSMSH